jgi:hypothetical protein
VRDVSGSSELRRRPDSRPLNARSIPLLCRRAVDGDVVVRRMVDGAKDWTAVSRHW